MSNSSEIIDEVPITLLASVEAKYIDIDFLNRWAIRAINKLPAPSYWVENLEFCQSIKCAEMALNEELNRAGIDVSKILPKLLIGFLYLRLKNGELSRLEFESEVIDIADAYDIVGLDVDYFSAALSKQEWDFDFKQLLDNMANNSLNHFHRMEKLAI